MHAVIICAYMMTVNCCTQNNIVMSESHGLNIVISLVLNEIKPLADEHMELALELKVHTYLMLYYCNT